MCKYINELGEAVKSGDQVAELRRFLRSRQGRVFNLAGVAWMFNQPSGKFRTLLVTAAWAEGFQLQFQDNGTFVVAETVEGAA